MKILFIDSAHPSLKIELESNGITWDEDFTSPKSEIENKISSYNGIILRSRFNIDRLFIDKLSLPLGGGNKGRVLFIARLGAGMEHIDVAYAESKGLQCISSPEGNRNAVAEHALGMLLTLLNNIAKANAEVKVGQWLREANRGTELEGKTVGIYGYGNTGTAFAKLLRGFEVKVMVFDKYKNGFGNEFVKESSPDEIFSEADILSIHLPLTDETKCLVSDSFLNSFKKNIYLINTSRGPIVNTNDLVSNLKNGKVLGACLDVLEYEEGSFELMQPKTTNQKPEALQYLLNNDKVILSPHIAGWSFESSEKMARILAEKIIALKK
jgi:D-3-phosphoglycerate dehydrogenase / 2-oxoglutarate reductase